MPVVVIVALLSALVAGCGQTATPAPSPVMLPSIPTEAQLAAAQDWTERRDRVLRRFPPSALGSERERYDFARVQAEGHVQRRRELGYPEQGLDLRLRYDTDTLAYLPILTANAARLRGESERQGGLDRELAQLDGSLVTQAQLRSIARARLDAERPGLSGPDRRDALATIERDLRQAVEERAASRARRARDRREAELTRLAGTNLADMPREIQRAAAENLADARSPFVTAANWRPSAEALRAEEVRLREAILSRQQQAQQATQAAAFSAQAAAMRDQIIQQCQMQAAIAGASVPTPYAGRGLGGAVAAGLLGGLQQGLTEANVLQSCLRAAGL